jgi:hypothetical protein
MAQQPTLVVNVRVPVPEYEAIKALAERRGTGVGVVLRDGVRVLAATMSQERRGSKAGE